MSEALEFAKRSNLDTEKVLEAISQGASASWYLSNRSETMLAGEFDHGFAVDGVPLLFYYDVFFFLFHPEFILGSPFTDLGLILRLSPHDLELILR